MVINNKIWEGKFRIVDEICKCGHLMSHHITEHLGCRECDCKKWSFSDRWVIKPLEIANRNDIKISSDI